MAPVRPVVPICGLFTPKKSEDTLGVITSGIAGPLNANRPAFRILFPGAVGGSIRKRDKEVVRLSPANLEKPRPATPCGTLGIYQDFTELAGFLYNGGDFPQFAREY